MTFTLVLKNCSLSPIIQRCNIIAVLSHFYSKDHTMISCNQSVRWRSSLIYKMNTRNEQHECDKSSKSVTQVWYEQHECNTNNTSVTQVKNFDFDNASSADIFSHSHTNFKERKNFILRTFEKWTTKPDICLCQKLY